MTGAERLRRLARVLTILADAGDGRVTFRRLTARRDGVGQFRLYQTEDGSVRATVYWLPVEGWQYLHDITLPDGIVLSGHDLAPVGWYVPTFEEQARGWRG